MSKENGKLNLQSDLKNRRKSNSTILTKKKIILASLATIVVASPISIGISQISFNEKKQSMNFDSVSKSLGNEINTLTKKVEGNDTKWKLTYNNTTKTFNSPEELRAFMYDNFLVEKTVTTNLDLDSLQNEVGQINPDDDFFKNVDETNSNKIENKDAYKGYGDIAYANEEDAKKSYFQVKDGYNYNGVYFKSKTDLNNYLLTNASSSSNKVNSVVIEGPNGVKSAPINVNDSNAANDIKSFISNNAEKVISYTNKTNNETFDINKNNLESSISKVDIKDMDYIHMYSNEGQSRYVVDNSIYDNNNLIGPYFYNGVLDVGSFMNKSMWKKTTGIKKQAFLSSKVDEMIGQFFTSIINDDNVLNIVESRQENKVPPIFRTLLYVDENEKITREDSKDEQKKKMTLDDWYMLKLAELSPALAIEVVQTNRALLAGKKYNTFYKIPIMYSFIMQRIASYNLGPDVMKLTVDYFTSVANFIQDAIEIVTLDDKELLTREKDGKVFNVKEFFQIGNPEYNLNTSTEYFLNEIKTYSRLIGAMSTFIGAQNNITTTTGLIPFKAYNQEFLFDFGIISRDGFYGKLPVYEAIYSAFSSLTYSEMLDHFVKHNKNPRIYSITQYDKEKWGVELEKINSTRTNTNYASVLKGIGMKNTEYHDLARGLINTEIRLFNATGEVFDDGYLSKLFNPDIRKDRLGPYINFMVANPKLDAYRVYLAMIADIRTSGRFFTDPSATADPYALAQAISRLIGFAFGTAYMATTTIKSIYNNYKKKPTSVGTNTDSNIQQNGTWENHWVEEPIYDVPDGGLNLAGRPSGMSNDEWVKWKRAAVAAVPGATLHPLYKYFQKRGIEYAGWSTINGGSIGTIGQWGGTIWGDINKQNESIARFGSVRGTGNDNPDNKEFPMSKYKTIYAEIKRPPGLPPIDNSKRVERLFKFLDSASDFDDGYNIKYASLKGFGDVVDGISSPIYENVNGSIRSRQSLVSPFEEAISLGGVSWDTTWDTDSVVSGGSNNAGNGSTNGSINGGSGSINGGSGSINGGNGTNNGNGTTNGGNGTNTGNGTTNGGNGTNTGNGTTNGGNGTNTGNGTTTGGNTAATQAAKKKSAIRMKWSGRSALSKVKNFANLAANVLAPLVSTGLFALEIFFLISDFVKEEYTQEFYVYTTADGTEFIWDGGLTVSRYLGFEVKQLSSIDSMKLVKPIQVTLPQVEEFYYFNSNKYYDANSLKRSQLKYILESGNVPNNDRFKIKFSLLNVSNSNSFNSVDELIKNVFEDMNITQKPDGSYDFSNFNQNSKYISNAGFSFANGVTVDSSHTAAVIAKNVTENIRATKIVKLFKNNDDTSIENFKFPGKYWDGSKVVTSEENINNYLIDNSANQLKTKESGNKKLLSASDYLEKDISKAEKNSQDKLFEAFKANINIQTKKTSSSQLSSTNRFSSLLGETSKKKLYVVNLPGRGAMYFSNMEKAQSVIANALGIKKEANYTEKVYYEYKGIIFEDLNEIVQWAKNRKFL